METPVMLATLLAGLVALASIVAAVRTRHDGPAGRTRMTGWIVVALGAALQLFNLLQGYAWTLSFAATAAMVLGLLLAAFARAPGARPLV